MWMMRVILVRRSVVDTKRKRKNDENVDDQTFDDESEDDETACGGHKETEKGAGSRSIVRL